MVRRKSNVDKAKYEMVEAKLKKVIMKSIMVEKKLKMDEAKHDMV